MELSSAFNGPAASGAEPATHGETGTRGGGQGAGARSAQSHVSSSPANDDNAVMADAPPATMPHAGEGTPDHGTIHPEAQARNDAQDRRLAEEARISDENMRARLKLERDLAQRYGDSIRQLRSEISELESILSNSGPIRLGWLKLTRQLSRDPRRDLNLLQSTLEMYEKRRAEDRQAFEARIRERAQARQARSPRSEATQNQETRTSDSQDRRTFTKEQAANRLEFLEGHRSEPVHEMHLRPGGKAEEIVRWDVATRRETEISLLKAFMQADHDPEIAAEQELDDGIGPSFY